MTKQEFLNLIEEFLQSYQIPPTTFGILSVNSPSLVFDLKEGRECREATQAKILKFIKDYKEKIHEH